MNGADASVQAVVFDWAGTVVDFGSLAPVAAFRRLFEAEGVPVAADEARAPMGLAKWDHIQALGRQPRVAQAWAARHGRPFDDADVDRLYAQFGPISQAAVLAHAELVPGAAQVLQQLRAQGLRVGSTTGYSRELMAQLVPLAAQQGFEPEHLVCGDDLPQGRPAPLGLYQCFVALGVWPAHRVVKVDDTVPGLLEGRHAGCWSVAVLASGNATGLSLAQWQALDEAGREQRRQAARQALAEAAPDFFIDTVAALPEAIAQIEQRLRQGLRPRGA